MKAVEVNSLDDPQLVEFVGRAREELFNLRFQHATGQLENTTRLNVLRKDIARINTLLREREIAAAEALETSNG